MPRRRHYSILAIKRRLSAALLPSLSEIMYRTLQYCTEGFDVSPAASLGSVGLSPHSRLDSTTGGRTSRTSGGGRKAYGVSTGTGAAKPYGRTPRVICHMRRMMKAWDGPGRALRLGCGWLRLPTWGRNTSRHADAAGHGRLAFGRSGIKPIKRHQAQGFQSCTADTAMVYDMLMLHVVPCGTAYWPLQSQD